jgi:hypothetical protein
MTHTPSMSRAYAGWRAVRLLSSVALIGCSTLSGGTAQQSAPSALPERLSDREFWQLVTDISEPGGYFRIEDNFTSNETEVGQIFTMLRETGVGGDVFLGVGPEQNYTYIAAIRPRMAFIIDIRRQAVMQHLMFKAMFEMSRDRADFVAILFGKPRPAGLNDSSSIEQVWSAFRGIRSDSMYSNANYDRLVDLLTNAHGFAFDAQERAQLRHVYNAFYYYGPSITTRGPPSMRGGTFMTLTGFSLDTAGEARSFLSTEENFRVVKSLHDRNLIIPISGDFGGPKAIRAIGDYLRQRNAVVRAFYVSNVEQYLFGDGVDKAFYANVATLPVDSASVFIRPYTLRRFFRGSSPWSEERSEALCSISVFLRSVEQGRVQSNNDALSCPQ